MNQKQYGLEPHYYKCVLRLPKATQVKIYEPDKILNSRRKMSTVQKINHLMDLRKALERRIRILEAGKEIRGFVYVKYNEYLDMKTQAMLNETW